MISLNASIEAVRAGEQGKAFGVVAEEIRSLANKSKLTVDSSEAIAQESLDSINSVTAMIETVNSNIEKAHISISIIYQSLNNTLQNSTVKKNP